MDPSGPTVIERDFLRFTGPAKQDVLSVETHGVQKVNGVTDVDTVLTDDDEEIIFQLGDTNATPGSGTGFFSEQEDQLVLGAATTKIAAGAVADIEYLHVRMGFQGSFKKQIDFE